MSFCYQHLREDQRKRAVQDAKVWLNWDVSLLAGAPVSHLGSLRVVIPPEEILLE